MEYYRLHRGDCLEYLRTLPDSSVDSVVTDPPYGLSKEPDMAEVLRHWLNGDDYQHKGGGFMGKGWDSFVPGPAVWRECLRVLKPGGHLLSFFGTRTYDMGVLAIRLAGFEIRDQIAWVYGSGFPKSYNGEWGGTALKPALEPIAVARKPLKGTVAKNWEAYGTGGLNIDGCRVSAEAMRTNTGAGGLPRRRDDEVRGPGVVTQPHADGRWPANLVHDGSEEVIAGFPANASASAPVRGTESSKASVGNITGERERVPGVFHGDKGSAARFFYCAKASRKDRNEGCEHLEERSLHWSSGDNNPGSFQRAGTNKAANNNHPTVKPTDLMRWLCRLVTPPGGTILDPYTGSGSTGKAAILEGFYFIGCEKDEDEKGEPLGYSVIAHARMDWAVKQRQPDPANDNDPAQGEAQLSLI